jgi:hypothetical protein
VTAASIKPEEAVAVDVFAKKMKKNLLRYNAMRKPAASNLLAAQCRHVLRRNGGDSTWL